MGNQETPNELSVKLYWDLANALSPESHTNKLLRSFYLTTCKKIGRRDGPMPENRFSSAVMCPKCSSPWCESKFALSLKSQHIRSQKAARLVDTLKSNPKSLTRKQKTRAKWLRKRITTNLETKCGLCQKKILHALQQPKRDKDASKQPPEPAVEVSAKKRKKKKSKDKSAGLKLTAIVPAPTLSSSPSNLPKTNNKSKSKPKQQKVVISQTQKQNSLLQLANLLKSRASTETTKPKSKLEKLLR